MLAREFDQFFREMAFDFVVARGIQRSRSGVGRMDVEAAVGLFLDVKGELYLARASRKLQARKIDTETGKNCGLDLLLQLVPCGTFDRRNIGVRRARDESTFRLGLDPVHILRRQPLNFHARIVARTDPDVVGLLAAGVGRTFCPTGSESTVSGPLGIDRCFNGFFPWPGLPPA